MLYDVFFTHLIQIYREGLPAGFSTCRICKMRIALGYCPLCLNAWVTILPAVENKHKNAKGNLRTTLKNVHCFGTKQ